MAEYIDREALIAEYDRVHIGAPGGARKLMVEAPAADVVEVVRCKECEHFVVNGQGTWCKKQSCIHTAHRFPNDYCSYGVRKGGEE